MQVSRSGPVDRLPLSQGDVSDARAVKNTIIFIH